MENNLYQRLADEGFPYSCSCGEAYTSEAAAWSCRKCRQYLMPEDFRNREVFFTKPLDKGSK